jgi:hypothetical protein
MAKVFVSCGQRLPSETSTAIKIRDLLRDKFGLDSYLAFTIQSVEDVMRITRDLSSCDYYLFIDFRREPIRRRGLTREYRGSLFTHQELALAHHLAFPEMIALKQEGVVMEGFAQYVLSNPDEFSQESDLLSKIEKLVLQRGWHKEYSRNLVVAQFIQNPPCPYRDHSPMQPRTEIIWHCRTLNKRRDKAAVNTLAVLKKIEYPNGSSVTSPDQTYLKWAFQFEDYSRTVFPNSEARFDLLAIDCGNPLDVYLHSRLDVYSPNAQGIICRQPVITGSPGVHKLSYQVFAENFPILDFTIELNLTGNINTTTVK